VDHSTSTSRRAFLRTTGAAGATLAAGAALVNGALPAAAQTATTTTVPTVTEGNFTFPDLPKTPTATDLVLISYANSLARAAVLIYDEVIDAKTAESATDILVSFRQNHRAHAEALLAMSGPAGASVANRTLLAEYSGSALTARPLPMLTQLENSILATYDGFLGELIGTDPAGLIASIVPILARQLVVLGELQQAPPSTYLPSFDSSTDALPIAGYPVERV
jgi:hypothetical protein